ncbi:hypothetical protein V3C99_015623 [Haemonchus contortus]
MMFSVDVTFNSPCYETDASSSYEYLSISSTALCASTSSSSMSCNFADSFATSRSNVIARRLIQLCDNFDREFCQPSSCESLWTSFICRLFI